MHHVDRGLLRFPDAGNAGQDFGHVVVGQRPLSFGPVLELFECFGRSGDSLLLTGHSNLTVTVRDGDPQRFANGSQVLVTSPQQRQGQLGFG